MINGSLGDVRTEQQFERFAELAGDSTLVVYVDLLEDAWFICRLIFGLAWR